MKQIRNPHKAYKYYADRLQRLRREKGHPNAIKLAEEALEYYARIVNYGAKRGLSQGEYADRKLAEAKKRKYERTKKEKKLAEAKLRRDVTRHSFAHRMLNLGPLKKPEVKEFFAKLKAEAAKGIKPKSE